MFASRHSSGAPMVPPLALSVLLLSAAACCASAGGAGPADARDRRQDSARSRPEGPRISISAALGSSLPGPGKAGVDAAAPPPLTEERSGPAFTEAFSAGFDFFLSASYAFAPAARIEAELEYASLNGKSRDEGYLGTLEYSDFEGLFAGIGVRFSAPLSVEPGKWFTTDASPRTSGFEPYLRLAVGLCYLDRVELESVGGYWKASVVFFAEACIGIEFGLGPLGLFAEAAARYVSEPVEAVWFAEADQMAVFPIRAGVRIYF